MSDDFPFTFGDASDEDEGSAGLFCAPKTKNSARIKAPAEQEPYHAQIDEDGWFHHTGKSVRELMMQDKNGANKVKMRADHYYMLRRYQEAYEIAKEYCEIVASNDVRSVQGDGGLSRSSTITDAGAAGVLKVTDSKELQEMAVRCALKLGKTDEAAKLADELTLQDTGVVFLKAKAYMTVGRYNAPYAQMRFDREMKVLEVLRLELERSCGINVACALDGDGSPMDKVTPEAAAQSRLEEYQRKVVLPAQDTLRVLQEDTPDGSNCPVEQEVVEFIVAAWDAQLVAPSPTGATDDDDEDGDEARARNK
ncbi:hypothetical protein BGZ68_008232 [Mortierella alpina]|nr:hypothetical protein BGZ68_008232 [Mortierella alpina]